MGYIYLTFNTDIYILFQLFFPPNVVEYRESEGRRARSFFAKFPKFSNRSAQRRPRGGVGERNGERASEPAWVTTEQKRVRRQWRERASARAQPDAQQSYGSLSLSLRENYREDNVLPSSDRRAASRRAVSLRDPG